jgi:hypothetical protein
MTPGQRRAAALGWHADGTPVQPPPRPQPRRTPVALFVTAFLAIAVIACALIDVISRGFA